MPKFDRKTIAPTQKVRAIEAIPLGNRILTLILPDRALELQSRITDRIHQHTPR